MTAQRDCTTWLRRVTATLQKTKNDNIYSHRTCARWFKLTITAVDSSSSDQPNNALVVSFVATFFIPLTAVYQGLLSLIAPRHIFSIRYATIKADCLNTFSGVNSNITLTLAFTFLFFSRPHRGFSFCGVQACVRRPHYASGFLSPVSGLFVRLHYPLALLHFSWLSCSFR